MSMYRRRLMMANAPKKSGGYINYPGLIAAWDILKEGKNNQHPDREWARDLTGNGRDIHWINVAYNEEGSGYKDGAMYLDGVDDYGVNENMPILTDYTIICKRVLLQNNNTGSVISKAISNYRMAFYFEGYNNNEVWSFGKNNPVKAISSNISYMSKNSYNGETIESGTATDGNVLLLSASLIGNSYRKNMAFYSAYLFDRSLDEQEIKAFIRKYIDPEYLLPTEK